MRRHLRAIIVIALLVIAAVSLAVGDIAAREATLDAIVKVQVSMAGPDPISPWQRLSAESGFGSGAIIEGERILTNAHVVAHAVDIQVTRHGDPDRYPARVLFIDHARDLALLTVDEPRFFAGVKPLRIAPTPARQTRVQVLGYPVGGESLCVTEGVLSRFEMDLYVHGFSDNLVVQLDASINGGNSGGPVVGEGWLIGLAMQTLDEAENAGYCIPTPVIEQFFNDLDDGVIDGVPDLGVATQTLHSASLRASLGMPDGLSGALIASVIHGSAADGVLRPGDVLTAIDGHAVGNDGTVDVPRAGRVDAAYVWRSRQVGDRLALDVWRDGEPIQLATAMTVPDLLVAMPRYRDEIPYVVCGGLVFTSFDVDYLFLFDEAPSNLLTLAFDANQPSAERSEAVVLVRVLPHGVNQGYQQFEDLLVETVMGQRVRDLAHMQSLLSDVDEPWITITFEDDSRVVMSTAEVQAAADEIGRRFGVRSMMLAAR